MKKTILFVDDDPLLLEIYPFLLEELADGWEVDCVAGGARALERLEAKKYDVVVSDLHMPGMNGIQLMNDVCRRQPEASRIIISGLCDQEQIARSLETTHQFLCKPIHARDLVATLSRIGKLDRLLLDEQLKALAGRLGSLPSFPSIYLRIMQELNTEEPELENIADLTLQDPALIAKMLQVANSAAFGRAEQFSNPFSAVQFLGLNAVRTIALSAHVFHYFEQLNLKGFSAHQVWTEALRCARVTRHLMGRQLADETATEDACAAAMLHNTGKLILAQNLPLEYEAMVALADAQNLSLAEAGREVFGSSHPGVAAYLFGLWGLPAPMVEAVALHLEPGESETRVFSPLTAVHVAGVFCAELWPGHTPGRRAELDLDYLQAVGVAPQIEGWRAEIKKLVASPG